jgi:NAD(P)-dependent dehydrogenase (short-subunit alcohol dehydrogenase family)
LFLGNFRLNIRLINFFSVSSGDSISIKGNDITFQFTTDPKAGPGIYTGKIIDPKKISGTVLWLCSNASSFMTGKEIFIGGGQGIHP